MDHLIVFQMKGREPSSHKVQLQLQMKILMMQLHMTPVIYNAVEIRINIYWTIDSWPCRDHVPDMQKNRQ